ncbi:MAG: chloride channel protein, partial [Candidatus Hodarchaeota archaeon]
MSSIKNIKQSVKSIITNTGKYFHTQFYALTPLVRLNILAVLVGIVGGVGSWVFRLAINLIYEFFFLIPQRLLSNIGLSQFCGITFLLAPVLGGLIVGFFTSRVSKETKGHGVPEVLEAVVLHDGRMNLKVPFIKILASATTIGSGGSAGREGPIAQIGAGFASLVGQWLDLNPQEIRTLVVSGVCAGISATFNAPIGGALFGLEVVRRESSLNLFIPLIVSSVVGTVIGQILLGTNPAFENFPMLEFHNPALIPLFLVLGLMAGIGSAFWIKIFYKSEDIMEGLFKKFKIPELFHPAIGGFCVGLILLITFLLTGNAAYTDGTKTFPLWEAFTIMGRTYIPMDLVFSGFLTSGVLMSVLFLLITLFILKMLATIFTVGTGGSGGVFAPTLFLGVMLGAIFGVIARDIFQISGVNVTVFALLGMAAFFAGTGRAPLTAIIMTAEMTNDYFLAIPLMFVVAISWLVSGKLEHEDIYVRKLTRRGVKIQEHPLDILETIKVSEIMTPREELVIIDLKSRLETVLEIVRETKHEGFPVFDQNQFIGVITLHDVRQA